MEQTPSPQNIPAEGWLLATGPRTLDRTLRMPEADTKVGVATPYHAELVRGWGYLFDLRHSRTSQRGNIEGGVFFSCE